MEKKMPIAIKILGWLIIVSHAIFLYQTSPLIAFKLGLPVMLPLAVTRVTAYITIIFSPVEMFMVFPAFVMLFANPILSIIGIVCGVGILRHKNVARIYVVVISWVRIVTGLIFSSYVIYRAPGEVNLYYIILGYLPYIICILFFTRPKVKAQFR